MIKKTPILTATINNKKIVLEGDEAMGLMLQLESLDLSGDLQTQVQYVDPATDKMVRLVYGCCGDTWTYSIRVENVDAIPCEKITCDPYVKP